MKAELRALLLVYAGLLALLAMTVGASFLSLDGLSPVASFGIAALKTGLIVWFFMNFRAEGWPVRLAALAGFVWLAILLTLLMLDLASRNWLMPFFTASQP
ncbi:MAG: cytochrome C oxidase subunit IV family protein [Methylobacterium mesophilicum]|nr:cytochrome C oxidase subunit IV family protein [Methylobacterium mesophilicum]